MRPLPPLLYRSSLKRWSRISKSGWVCANCRSYASQTPHLRRDGDAPQKPFYVTTPIFYVNAAPHVGHLYSMVLADVLKRWQQLKGNRAVLCTGTDEHGMKIQRAARLANMDPQSFCDQAADVFKRLAASADITNDHFVRTTDADHKETVRYVWHVLQDRGLIYRAKHEGWYSVSDETFYPESQVHLVLEPQTGRKIMASIETGKEVEWTSEMNYHFRLSRFRDRLLQYYDEHPDFIVPNTRMTELYKEIQSGLSDLSISRPRSRLDWGIRVPDDQEQTIYVWLDALVNYITKAGYPWAPGYEVTGGWPVDCHIIGKDITRFHCIYWPAFLMALGIELPSQILTHGHWTLGRKKMSKSEGNGVNPFFQIDRFGVDVVRFFLMHDGGIDFDPEYNNFIIIERYNDALKSVIGNQVSRVLRGKSWDTRYAVTEMDRLCQQTLTPADREQLHLLQTFPTKFQASMDNLNVREGVTSVVQMLRQTQKYFQVCEPWSYFSAEARKRRQDSPISPEDNDKVHLAIALTLESFRLAAITLQPVMPERAGTLLDWLNVSLERRSFAFATLGADKEYGDRSHLVKVSPDQKLILFPTLITEE
ncbi:methionyl-tRNA synthetase-like protein [Eremomyces bilateralis CBS 781.70]|uniref:Probable methionine--tRNA ligase, mitochondrial n=1 Tax=Eremomyces bilateralis CBS 781.70 TaxID=1392243 RepID=A0A6G1GCV9_9PEZI|nr:methionyl-tRNA synthetase-like protein [Eremomyces bilateralis CBS 781.70]KAF1815874.1 methionyl-tRNA synthetase-like protein [Eremomyces bilateralis CBS 781.70]